MTTSTGSFTVHSAARGPHCIAWVSQPGSQDPHRSIVLIGATQAEAEARARAWAERNLESGFQN
jgi:hypothetical protein